RKRLGRCSLPGRALQTPEGQVPAGTPQERPPPPERRTVDREKLVAPSPPGLTSPRPPLTPNAQVPATSPRLSSPPQASARGHSPPRPFQSPSRSGSRQETRGKPRGRSGGRSE